MSIVRRILMVGLLSAGSAVCAAPADLDQAYPRLVTGEDITFVLQTFTSDTGIITVPAAEVIGNVRQNAVNLSAREFLDSVTGDVGATWFYSDGVVYVTPLAQVRQTVYDVSAVAPGVLEEALAGIVGALGRSPLRVRDDGRIATASGSPEMLDIVTDIVLLEGGFLVAAPSDADDTDQDGTQQMIVFRGRVGG